ncbi:MAG: hypothetical protein ACXVJB_11560 [Mucilaginibacter sp.]
MAPFFKTLLEHPVSVVFYLLYTALCGLIMTSNIRYHHWLVANPGKHGVSYGEGIMFGILFLLMVGGIFGLILIINAIVRKQPAFYVWLLLLVFIQTVVAIAI